MWLIFCCCYILLMLYVFYQYKEVILIYTVSDVARNIDLLFEDKGLLSSVYRLILPAFNIIFVFLLTYSFLYKKEWKYPRYSLWVYSPLPERQSIFYVQDLSTDIHESLRAASSLCYYSPRCILLVEYNAKRMQSKGDDIISFGKYHGHFLHEIFRIDPAYVSWIAYKFTPRIPKQERFVQIAQVYHSVHLDIQKRQAHQKYSTSRFLGKEGDKVKELTLKVLRVRLEDDPYKTTVKGTTPYFYVRQILTLEDPIGNLVTFRTNSRTASPGIVPGARYGTCLRARRIGIYCLGTHLVPLLRETNNTPASIMSSLNKLKR